MNTLPVIAQPQGHSEFTIEHSSNNSEIDRDFLEREMGSPSNKNAIQLYRTNFDKPSMTQAHSLNKQRFEQLNRDGLDKGNETDWFTCKISHQDRLILKKWQWFERNWMYWKLMAISVKLNWRKWCFAISHFSINYLIKKQVLFCVLRNANV